MILPGAGRAAGGLRGDRPAVAAVSAAACLLAGVPPAAGQAIRATPQAGAYGPGGDDAATARPEAPGLSGQGAWPFAVGEEATYRVGVSLGPAPPRPVGSARLAVEARDSVDGHPAYRVAREMEARVPFVYRLDDRQVSWITPDPFRSLRFEEHLEQGDYRRHRRYRLDHSAGSYTRWDRSPDDGWRRAEGEVDVPMPEHALDEVAFLYFVRTLPLEVGETHRFHRLFEADDNPVELEVLRRERVRVPAGTYETLVVHPVIRADGLFSEEGRAEVYLADDERRTVVKIDSRMKVGRVELVLESYRPGPEAVGGASFAAATRRRYISARP